MDGSETAAEAPDYSNNIFDEPWWMDAATGGNYDVIEIIEGGRLIGRFVYSVKSRLGIKKISTPFLSRTIEPYIFIEQKKEVTRTLRRIKVLEQIVKSLPLHHSFEYTLPPETTLALPFACIGHGVRQKYTFRYDPNADGSFETLVDQKVRNIIKTACGKCLVSRHSDIDEHLKLFTTNTELYGDNRRIYVPAVKRIFVAAATQNRATILACRDTNGNLVSSSVLVWDLNHVYFWLSARDMKASGNWGIPLLISQAAEFAKERRLILDLDGFHSPSSGAFLVKFGFKPVARMQAFKQRWVYGLIENIRSMASASEE